MTADQQSFSFPALRHVFARKKSRASSKPKKKMSHKDLFTDSLMASGVRSYMVMPGQPVWMDRNYSQFAMEAYVRNVIAHRAMGMVAGAASSVKLKLFDTNSKRGRREVTNHPVLGLIKQANPTQAKAEFFQALYQYKMISGNAFIQAVGPKDAIPNELHLLRPDRVAIIAGKGTMPAGYRYTVNGQYTDFSVDRITGQSQILHLKNFHPLNDWYGLSPVEAAAYSIDQHNQSGAWNQALLQNGARPSGALVVRVEGSGGGTLSEDQYNRVKLQIDEQFTGSANAGRPLLLEGGLDWKEMSLTPKDMDFIEAKNSSARDIALAFGVPPQLLGIPGDNTYSNLQEARLALWEQTVVPLVQATTDALNSWLIPMFGGQLELCLDTDGISALAIRNQAIWDRVEKSTFLTDDEKRAAVGYGPLPVSTKTTRRRTRKKIKARKDDDGDFDDDGGDDGQGGYVGDNEPNANDRRNDNSHQNDNEDNDDDEGLYGLSIGATYSTRGGVSYDDKIKGQMGERDWIDDQIDEAQQYGDYIDAINKTNGEPFTDATRYVHPETGASVVIDDETNQAIQVGQSDFIHNETTGDAPGAVMQSSGNSWPDPEGIGRSEGVEGGEGVPLEGGGGGVRGPFHPTDGEMEE